MREKRAVRIGTVMPTENRSRAQLDRLLPELYHELRALAARELRRERPGHTLQTTALVHEAYLRLAEQRRVPWQDRRQILAAAASAMRRILVNHARRRAAQKRQGRRLLMAVEYLAIAKPTLAPIDLLALDEALSRLAVQDTQQARVVELRYFGGLTLDEVAEEVGTSLATVKREWAMGKAWLFRELNDAGDGE